MPRNKASDSEEMLPDGKPETADSHPLGAADKLKGMLLVVLIVVPLVWAYGKATGKWWSIEEARYIIDAYGRIFGRENLNLLRIPLVPELDKITVSVNRAEAYPDYENFDTPDGRPVFYLDREKPILTQIGGSTVVIPLGLLPNESRLRFQISFLLPQGDGAWAEASLRCGGEEDSLYRRYVKPTPPGGRTKWQGARLSLSRCGGHEAFLILRCYNEPGRTTVADWLSWMGLLLEVPQGSS